MSPFLFNLCINHILDELTEKDVSDTFGFRLSDDADPLTVLCFADDIVVIGKNAEAASTLVTMVINLLQEIGLHINPQKSEAIVLENGILTQTSIKTIYGDIQSISADERVK